MFKWTGIRDSWRVVLLGCCTWLVLVSPFLFTAQTLGFRDAAHYYPPLLAAVRQAWQEDWPLWNVWEERGRPLLADPTSLVCYPGALVAAACASPIAAQELLVAGHLAWAWATMFWLARTLHCSRPAACLAAVSYVASGPILFQAHNLPYLIGASWLPLGIAGARELVVGVSRWHCANKLSLALIMITWGGDPQLAYLLGGATLIGLVLAAQPLRGPHGRRLCGEPGSASAPLTIAPTLLRQAVPIFLCGAVAVGITAIQWLPTWDWARHSLRTRGGLETASPDAPPSLAAGTRHARLLEAQRYDFSVGPWRWCELLWPNLAGRPYPESSRWLRVIPAEGRYWSPTLYLGLLPMVYGLRGIRLRGGRWAQRWLSWLLVIGILGSLGGYGLGWLAREIAPAWLPADGRWDPVGGLYWCFTWLLPGFGWFRYPAKLWTWVAMSWSILAAMRLSDEQATDQLGPPVRFLKGYLVLSLSLALAVWLAESVVSRWLATCPTDALFGPLNNESAQRELVASLLTGSLIACCGLVAFYRSRSRPAWPWLILLLTTGDLWLAHRGLLPLVPESISGTFAAGFAPAEKRTPGVRTYREQANGMYPPHWSTTSSPDRLAACVRWDQRSQRPKYPLATGLHAVRSATSFSSWEQVELLRQLDARADVSLEAYLDLLEMLGVEWLVSRHRLPAERCVELLELTPDDGRASEFQLARLAAPWPRCWVATAARPVADVDTRTASGRSAWSAGLHQVLEDPSLLRDTVWLPRSALTANSPNRPPQPPPATARSIPSSTEHTTGEVHPSPVPLPQIEYETSGELAIVVAPAQPGWLVMNDSYLPGWEAIIEAHGKQVAQPVWRANGVMRAVRVDAGPQRIVLRYRPWSVRVGSAVSAASLLVGLMSMVWQQFQGMQQRKPRA